MHMQVKVFFELFELHGQKNVERITDPSDKYTLCMLEPPETT